MYIEVKMTISVLQTSAEGSINTKIFNFDVINLKG